MTAWPDDGRSAPLARKAARRPARWLPALLLVLLLIAPLGACDEQVASDTTTTGEDTTTDTPTDAQPSPQGEPGPDFSKLAPDCFVGGDTPLLDFSGPVADWTWNDPHVLKVGDQYWMYASATDNFVFPVHIYRLVSDDGVSWTLDPLTPVLSEGPGGAWDSASVETPAVVVLDGVYHLFYTGYTDQTDVFTYAVGHATSSDGVTFSKDPANPIVANTGLVFPPDVDFRQYIVAEPAPVIVDGELWLYFTAFGVDYDVSNTLQTIGVTIFDGTDWTEPVQALRPDQTLYPRLVDGGPAGWVGYSTPNAVVLDGEVHVFVDVAYDATGSDWRQVRLHHASSADGLTEWTQDSASILARENFDWTAREIRAPAPFLDGNTLRLYFAGDNLNFVDPPPVDHFGIGMVACDLSP